MLQQVEASLPQLSEEFYQMLADDIDKYFVEQNMVVSSLIEKIDSEEKRAKLLKDLERMIKRDISMFMAETVHETKSLQGKLKTLIETPEKDLTAEEKKMKELLIYFLYLIKTEKG
jgi:adenine C2-methylase RlmN of 23S rRNA A2503 and tRNA A37